MDEAYKDMGSIDVRLIEEMAELTHILCKAKRFGWFNWHPKDKDKTPNYRLVLDEMLDVTTCIDDMRKYILLELKEERDET